MHVDVVHRTHEAVIWLKSSGIARLMTGMFHGQAFDSKEEERFGTFLSNRTSAALNADYEGGSIRSCTALSTGCVDKPDFFTNPSLAVET
ncbi:hypothetical protein [Luteimonas sp. gir]|uniref:hypothetical protein n=1 Tax=Luteimonas sp. gir TaxID=3127960 RepID=UPI003075CEEE